MDLTGLISGKANKTDSLRQRRKKDTIRCNPFDVSRGVFGEVGEGRERGKGTEYIKVGYPAQGSRLFP